MNTAVIIGVGQENGLGGALCKRFASLGKHVFIAGRTQSKLDAIVSVIESNGGKATAHVTDCTDESQTQELFDAACETGSVDAAIYNAGNNFPGRIIDMEFYLLVQVRLCEAVQNLGHSILPRPH